MSAEYKVSTLSAGTIIENKESSFAIVKWTKYLLQGGDTPVFNLRMVMAFLLNR